MSMLHVMLDDLRGHLQMLNNIHATYQLKIDTKARLVWRRNRGTVYAENGWSMPLISIQRHVVVFKSPASSYSDNGGSHYVSPKLIVCLTSDRLDAEGWVESWELAKWNHVRGAYKEAPKERPRSSPSSAAKKSASSSKRT